MRGILIAVLAALMTAGCSRKDDSERDGSQLRALTSVLPMYVLTRNVVGDAPGIRVEALLPPSAGCPHDYALSPSDLRKIAAADIFIANGYGLEEYLGDPIRQANPKLPVIATAELAGIKPLRRDAHDEHDAHGHEVNPHTWVSPRNAIRQVREIEKALVAASPQNAEALKRNADAYVARLDALAQEMEAASKDFKNRNIVTFHNVFDYLAADLGLNVVGQIEAVPNIEPSPRQVREIVKLIRDKKVAAIFSEPQYSPRMAKMIADEAGVPVRDLDPVASGNDAATAYEDAMRKNLATLKEALGQ